MKRIIFISTYSLAEQVVNNRLTPFIDLALDRGFSVLLINPSGGEYHRENDINFSHLAMNVRQANRGGFFMRALREVLLARKVLSRVPQKSDIVFLTIPSMFLLFLFSNSGNHKKVIDIRDLTWEYLGKNSMLMNSARMVFHFLAKRKLAEFDWYCVSNNSEHRYLVKKMKINPDKVFLCSNGITRQQFQCLRRLHSNYSIGQLSRPCLSYIGNVGMAQNLTTLVEAAKQLPHVDFKIVGGGSDLSRIEAAARGVSNIELTGRINWSEIPDSYNRANLLWAQLKPDFSGAVPSKIYEYLVTGKPVIYGGLGEAVSVLSDFENIVLVEPENVSELVRAIKRCTSSHEYLKVKMTNFRKVESDYIRENSVERFYQSMFGA